MCDPIDERHRAILPAHVWGEGDPEGVRQRAAQEMIDTACAARSLGVGVVNDFIGSSIWHSVYAFPPTPQSYWDAGLADFARHWTPPGSTKCCPSGRKVAVDSAEWVF